MQKYYEDAKYNAAFERCVDVMARLIEKYGHQVLEKLASAEKTASIWKQRYDALNEKYQELKKKAQPYLDALEIASEKVRAFLNAILARGQEKQEHRQPDRRRGQNMEI